MHNQILLSPRFILAVEKGYKFEYQKMCSRISNLQYSEAREEESQPLLSSTSTTKSRVEKSITQPALFSRDEERHAIQRIIREGLLLAGGGVSILLQVANPSVGAGVNRHSNFAIRPTDRLRTTMTYVYCMAFGTPEERKLVVDMVHRVHDRVKGSDYNAHDPEMQLWVAATLYATGVAIYEKVFGKLSELEAEKTFQQYHILATSLRVPHGLWPATREQFWVYWDQKIETLEVTPHAFQVANDLLWNQNGPLWMRMTLPLVRILTTEWLPPSISEAYGLENSKSRRAVYAVMMRLLRVTYPHLPMWLREWPMRYYLKDMRRRIDEAGQA